MGEKLTAWGKPNITLFGKPLPNEFHPLVIEDTDIEEGGGILFHVPSEIPTISFGIDVSKEVIRSTRRLFRRRIPRKAKKTIKSLFAKKVGLKTKKIRFSMVGMNKRK